MGKRVLTNVIMAMVFFLYGNFSSPFVSLDEAFIIPMVFGSIYLAITFVSYAFENWDN